MLWTAANVDRLGIVAIKVMLNCLRSLFRTRPDTFFVHRTSSICVLKGWL